MATVSVRTFLSLLFQLVVVLAVIWFYQIEQMSGLFRLLPLILGGFIINSLIPLRFRPALFLAVSIAGILIVVPPPAGLAIVIIGLGLILICHLPIPMWTRVVLMLGAGASLIVLRLELIDLGWSSLSTLIIPIVGSMFMFRMIIYMYDIRHEEKGVSIWSRLSYFFMLPNVCFLLFPVVDYQTFKRNYYNTEAESIYRTGIWWMFRGVTHLLVYRLVYLYLVPSASEVEGIWGVAEAMVTTYALYLRISGQFHLIIGIMCLFGFNLPETNHLYFFASSATDYWRRINIYWKDFMAKIFYNNAFVRFKKYGVIRAVVLSTAVVFIVTWALHAYQWLWLRGIYPVSVPDSLFWGLFGLFAIASVVNEVRKPRRRRGNEFSFQHAFRHSLSVLGTFITIGLLWSLWSSSSVGAYFEMLGKVGSSSLIDFATFGGMIGLVLMGGVGLQYISHRMNQAEKTTKPINHSIMQWYPAIAGLLLIAVANPIVQSALPENASTMIASASSDRLNRADEEVMERGYYETLLEPNDYLSALWSSRNKRPPGWNEKLNDVGGSTDENSILMNVLVPSVSTRWKESSFTTNEFGMRDRSYRMEKPVEVYRYALLGASTEMGWGVNDPDVFESVVEAKFNADPDISTDIEILNFSVPSYTIIQTVKLLEDRVPDFGPDEILIVAHGNYDRRLFDMFCRKIEAEIDLEYDFLKHVVDESGVNSKQTRAEMLPRVEPFFDEMLNWGYGRVAEVAAERGLKVSLVYVPSLAPSRDDDSNFYKFANLAETYGFDLVDLRGAFTAHEQSELWLAPWDWHPNTLGHALLADEMLKTLKKRFTASQITRAEQYP
ncbi:MAG: hypothetical protein HKN43_10860 [Rhodothermales bacterium]|nr:hypothetical protein [Rhodothermales bacterium]